MPHCHLTTSLSAINNVIFRGPNRKHKQKAGDIKVFIFETLREGGYLSLCSPIVYVQAGSMAAFPPMTTTGQLRLSPCLLYSQHCSVMTNMCGHAGHLTQPPELCLLQCLEWLLIIESTGVAKTID